MTDHFHIDCRVDQPKNILRITTYGPIDSQATADRCIAFFKEIDRAWTYHRLYDQTKSTGLVKYEDLERMARALSHLWARASVPPRIAVANPNKLVAARMPLVSSLFVNPNHRVFEKLEDAEAWLMQQTLVD